MISVWCDTKQDNLAMTMVRNASNSVVAHYASKFPDYTRHLISSVPLGFQCGDLAERHWRYNAESKAFEEIIASDVERIADAKIIKIAEIKKTTGKYIKSLYPKQKQLNIIRAGTPEELTAMSAYIDPARLASDVAEEEVAAKDTLEKVEGYTFKL